MPHDPEATAPEFPEPDPARRPAPPPPDDGPDDDADLVAYLDGELDPDAARRVQDKLDADPDARRAAAGLKRAYDLLDYLPKPEPSATFASRTLDRLPAAKAPSGSRPATPPASGSGPVVLAASGPSGSVPVVIGGPPRRGWAVAFGVLAAVGLAGGYGGAAAARAYLGPILRGADRPALDDLRVFENLPLYAAVDHLEYLKALAEPELFGDDPAVTVDPLPGYPAADAAEKPWARHHDPLVKAFRAMPADRQRDVRRLDEQLHAEEPAARDRLFRVMEAYAVWLDRLPDDDRRAVLAAPTPTARLQMVRMVREQQWVDALPPALRKQLDNQPKGDRAALINQWKEEAAERRRPWQLARRNWEGIRSNAVPWPFDDPALKAQVDEYVQRVLRPDDPKGGSRLTPGELVEYRDALDQTKGGMWWWYGALVHQFALRHPTLPEWKDKEPLTQFSQLGAKLEKRLAEKKDGKPLKPLAGKWPEFALGVADEVRKFPQLGSGVALGPSRPAEFKPEVADFVTNTLMPKLSKADADELKRLEGQWPDYPRRMVDLATNRKYNLPVPGVTLPGPPAKWEETYSTRGGRPNPPKPKDVE